MHRLLLVLLLFSCSLSYAQPDLLLLKKGGRTYKTYFKGSHLSFQLTNYQWLSGRIAKLTNDSIYFQYMNIGMVPNKFGLGAIPDTTYSALVPLAMSNIRAIPNDKHSLNYVKNGTLLQFGAAGYAAINLFNTVRMGEPLFDQRNSKRLGIAAVVFLIGKFLQKRNPEVIRLGRKYKLMYVKGAS